MLVIENCRLTWSDFEADYSLSVQTGNLCAVIGPSGGGKTTLLHMIAGFERPESGTLRFNGQNLLPLEPAKRPVAIVFQDHNLFPWMRARENVAFNLKARGMPAKERLNRADQMMAMVGLLNFASKYPHQLSGGMRQRIGIARALTTNPQLLLMDEPFGALDAQTRSGMQTELLRIWDQQKVTVLFVTHSVSEAVYLADRVVVMTPRPGRIKKVIQIDLPRPRDQTSPEFNECVRRALFELHDDLSAAAPD